MAIVREIRSSDFEVQSLEQRLLLSADILPGAAAAAGAVLDSLAPQVIVQEELGAYSIDGGEDTSADEAESLDLCDCESLDALLGEPASTFEPAGEEPEKILFSPMGEEEAMPAADETFTWSGAGTTNNWNDAQNWSGGVAPSAGAYVSFETAPAGTTVVIDSSVALGGLDSTNVDLQISGELVLSGAVMLGDVTVLDGGSLVLDETVAGDLSGTLAAQGNATVTSAGGLGVSANGQVLLADTASLIIEGGEMHVGGLVSAAGNSSILLVDGQVSFDYGAWEVASGATFEVQGGAFNLGNGVLLGMDNSAVAISGGSVTVTNESLFELGGASALTLSGGSLLLEDGSINSEQTILLSGGTVAGSGLLNADVQAAGVTLAPGGQSAVGELIISGELQFDSPSTIQFEGLNSQEHDRLSVAGNAFLLGGSLEIVLLPGHTFGTGQFFSPLNVDGVSGGTITDVQVTGDGVNANAVWVNGQLQIELVEETDDSAAEQVQQGLADLQARLGNLTSFFNLDQIDFASQGLSAFSLPTLPSALADIFDLSTAVGAFAFPAIGASASLSELAETLFGQGFSIEELLGGGTIGGNTVTDVTGDYSIKASIDVALASALSGNAAFDRTTQQLLAGLSSDFSLSGLLELAADLTLHLVFGVDASGFFVFNETFVLLSLAGAGTISGNGRLGGQTGVSLTGTGSAAIDLALRMNPAQTAYRIGDFDTGALATTLAPTATGNVSVAVDFSLGAVTSNYQLEAALDANLATLSTDFDYAHSLTGEIEIPGLTTTDGTAAAVTISGSYDSGTNTWTITAATASPMKLLEVTADSLSFTVNISPDAFSGSASGAATLDFLEANASNAEVDLSATFDSSSISFFGAITLENVTIKGAENAALITSDALSAAATFSGDFETGEMTGALAFEAGNSQLSPGSSFTVSITDGDDADSNALTGTIDFNTLAYALTVDEIEIAVANILRASAAGVVLSYNRKTATGESILASVDNVFVELLFLKNQSATGPPGLTMNGVTIRENGFAIATATAALGDVSIDSLFELTGASVTIDSLSYATGEAVEGSITFNAESATLFPGRTYTASITDGDDADLFAATGEVDLATGAFGLTLDTFKLVVTDIFEAEATGVTAGYDPNGAGDQTLFSLSSGTLSIIPLDVTGTLSGLTIRQDGFTLDGATLSTPSINIGGATNPIFTLTDGEVSVASLDYTFGGDLSGTISFTATSATLFPGRTYTASITDGDDADLFAATGEVDLATGAFALTLDTFKLVVTDIFEAEATGVTAGYDPNGAADQTLFSLSSGTLSIIPLDVTGTLSGLTIRQDGFTLDGATLSTPSINIGGATNPIFTLTDGEVSVASLDYTFGGDLNGTITFTATSATLFSGRTYTASITDGDDADLFAATGEVDLATGAFGLTLDTFKLVVTDIFEAEAIGVTAGYDPNGAADQTLFSLSDGTLSIIPLDVTGTLSGLTIRQDGFTLDGATLSTPSINIGGAANPIFTLTDGEVSVASLDYTFGGDLSGTISFTATSATLFPGRTYTASVTDGDDADLFAATGEVDLATGAFGLTLDTFKLVVTDIFETEATGVTAGYDPNGATDQTLFSLSSGTLSIIPLDVTGTLSGLTIRQDGFTLDGATLSTPSIKIGGATNPIFTLTDGEVSVASLDYTFGGELSGTITFTATSATLFPGRTYTASITDGDDADLFAATGEVDLATGAFALTLDTFKLVVTDIFEAQATGVTAGYDPKGATDQTLFSLSDGTLSIIPLDVTGTLSGLTIRQDGFTLDGATLSTPSINIGGATNPIFTLTDGEVSVASLDYTFGGDLSGTISFTATSATLFPGRTYTASITDGDDADLFAATGEVDLATGAFGLTLDTFKLVVTDIFEAEAIGVTAGYDPNGAANQTLFSLSSGTLSIIPLDVTGTLSGLTIRQDGFTLEGATLSTPAINIGGAANPIFTLTDGEVSVASLDYTFGGELSGTISFTATSATLFPGRTYTASITDGDDADLFAATGEVDLATGAFSITADQFLLEVANAFRATADGFAFSYDPNGAANQTLVSLDSGTIEIIPLAVSGQLEGLTVRGDGFSLAGGSISADSLTLAGLVEITAPVISVQDIEYTFGGELTGGFGVTAEAATLFPGKPYTASLTDGDGADSFAVSVSISATTGAFTVDVDTFLLQVGGVFNASANNFVISYDPDGGDSQTLVSLDSGSIEVIPLGVTGTLNGLEVRMDGFSLSEGSLTADALEIAGFLSINSPTITFEAIDYTFGGEISGAFGISAAAATLFPGKDYAATVTDSDDADAHAITGTLQISTGAFSFGVDTFTMLVPGVVQVDAQGFSIAYDPNGAADQVLVELSSGQINVIPVGVSGELHGLVLRLNGFSLDGASLTAPDLSIPGVLTIENPTVNFSGIDYTFGGEFEGGFGFSATGAIIFPGKAYQAIAQDGDDADDFAISGSVTADGVYAFTLDTFSLEIPDLLTVTSQGIAFNYDPEAGLSQTIATVNSGTIDVTALGLVGSLSGLIVRGDGFQIGSLTLTSDAEVNAGGVLQIASPSVTFANWSVTFGESVSISGSITIGAASASLFPGNTTFTTSVTGISGGFTFTSAGVDGWFIEAETFTFQFGDLVRFSATNFTFNPQDDIIASAGTIEASIPALEVGGTLTNLQITKDGQFLVTAFSVDVTGLNKTFGLANFLPFQVNGLEVVFLDDNGNPAGPGESLSLTNFELSVNGAFNWDVFGSLPFTPILRIGPQDAATELTSGADTFSFSIRFMDGVVVPWNLGPIEIGFADLKVGGTMMLGGSIRLGGYQEGVWVPTFGGTIELKETDAMDEIGGGFRVDIDGSFDDQTGLLSIDASLSVSFEIRDLIDVEGATINFSMDIQSQSDSGFALSVVSFTVESASVDRLLIDFGGLLSLETTDVFLNFMAEGDEDLATIGSLTANLTVIGLSGTARNFAIDSDGWAKTLPNFGVGFAFDNTVKQKLKLPAWLPITITEFDITWENIQENPTAFRIRISGTASSDLISGSMITVSGSVDDLVIDIGLLQEGKFPIVGIGGFGLEIGGDIAGTKISGALLLGLLPVDENGDVVADGDLETVIADRIFYGAIRGAIEIAGYGGVEISLGISQFGPVQGYIKAIVPIPVGGPTGFAITGLRAGIFFNTTLPDIEDPTLLGTMAGFQPASDLTFVQWQALLKTAVADQAKNAAESDDPLAALLSPFRIEGGATLINLYASGAAFQLEGDILMSSDGKFLIRGNLEVGGTLSLTAMAYANFSRAAEGRFDLLFLMQLPAELKTLQIYGRFTIDFGVVVDPENPPVAPFEQFRIIIEGGMKVSALSVASLEISGTMVIDVQLNMPRLEVQVEGTLAVNPLGDVIGLAGFFTAYFDDAGDFQMYAAFALQPRDFSMLNDIGLDFNAIAVLRFNTTDEAIQQELEIPGQSEPRTFELAPNSLSMLVEGHMIFELGGTEWFRMNGTFAFEWSSEGFDVLVEANLIIGPAEAPWVRLESRGYMKLILEGVSLGIAAKIDITRSFGEGLEEMGIVMNADFHLLLNTTGEDITYNIPTEFPETHGERLVHLPRGPPALIGDDSVIGEPGPYLIVEASGNFILLDYVVLTGQFALRVSGSGLEIGFDAQLKLSAGDTPFLDFDASGNLIVDSAGIYGAIDLTLSTPGVPSNFGFELDASYTLRLNTTNAEQQAGDVTLEAGRYLVVHADGYLRVGALELDGDFEFTVGESEISVAANGTLSIGVAGSTLFSFSFDGEMGITSTGLRAYLTLTLSHNNSAAWGFSFDATFGIGINTTLDEWNDIPGGLGARIHANGTLTVAGLVLRGSFDFTVAVNVLALDIDVDVEFYNEDDLLFSFGVAVDFELTLPGIVVDLALAIDTSAIGLDALGLDLEAEFALQINTTGQQHGRLEPGPYARLYAAGAITLPGVKLDGDFYFSINVRKVEITGSFDAVVAFGDWEALRMEAEGAFTFGFGGIGAFISLSVDTLDLPFTFGTDVSFFLAVNTSSEELTVGETVLEEGPYARIEANATITILGLNFVGDFAFSADATGVMMALTASLDFGVPGVFTFMSFNATGGFLLDSEGLAGALDLTVSQGASPAFGIELGASASFSLRLNTSAQERTIGDITIEGGPFARVEINGSATLMGLVFEGDFYLEVRDGDLIMEFDAIVELRLPELEGLPEVIFASFTVTGGLAITEEGLYAALEATLTAGPDADLGLEFGADASYTLHINSTGDEQEIGGVDLDAGNYAKVNIEGELNIFLLTLSGRYTIEVGSKGLLFEIAASLIIETPAIGGIPSVRFFEFTVGGGFSIDARGIAAAVGLTYQEGPSIDGFGLAFGAALNYTLRVNTTGEEVILGPVTLEAGHYADIRIQGVMSLGVAQIDGLFFVRLDENGLRIELTGTFIVGVGELELFRYHAGGGIQIDGLGVAAVIGLEMELGNTSDLGFSLGGANLSHTLVLNTTGEERELAGFTLDAGKYVEVHIVGSMTIAGFTLDGEFRLRIGEEGLTFEVTAGMALRVPTLDGSEGALLFSFRVSGGIQIGPSGLAAVLALSLDGSFLDSLNFDFLPDDGTWSFLINTTGEDITLAGVFIPGDTVTEIEVEGELIIEGFRIGGSFAFRAGAGYLEVEATAATELKIGDLVFLSFNVAGGFRIDSAGIAAAFTLSRQAGDPDEFGLSLGGEQSFTLLVNTTGEEHELGGIDLEAGVYAKVHMTGALGLGFADLQGDFYFSVGDTGLRIEAIATFNFGLPGLTIFSFSLNGGINIGSDGVYAVMALSRTGGAADSLGITLAEESYALRLNLTGAEQTIAGVTLDAGTYLEIEVNGSLNLLALSFSGDYFFRLADDGLTLTFDSTFDFGVPGASGVAVSLLTFRANGGLRITGQGIYGAMQLTRQAGGSALGMEIGGSSDVFSLRLNTTDSEQTIAGITLRAGPFVELEAVTALRFFGLRLEGQFFFSVDTDRLIVRTDAVLSVDIAGLNIFSFNAEGGFLITADGMALALDLSLRAGPPSGFGFSLDASFTLQASTFAGPITIPGVTTEFVDIEPISLTEGNFALITATGNLTVGGFVLDGSFEFGFYPAEGKARIFATASVSFFGLSSSFTGTFEVYTDGIVLDAALSVGGINNAFMTLTGEFRLQVNTRDIATLGIARNTVMIHITNARVGLLGFTLSGSMSMGVSDGIFILNVPQNDPLTANILGVLSASFWGTIRSDGVFSFNGTGTLDIGPANILRAQASLSLRLSNSAFSASGNGSLSILGGTAASMSASLNIDSGGFDMTVSVPGISLLGFGTISGQLSMSYRGSQFSFIIPQSRPVSIVLFGGVASVQIYGNFSSNGQFSFTGATSVDFGVRSLASLSGNLSVTVSNSGVSGSLNGAFYVLNTAVASFSGSVAFFQGGFDITINDAALRLGLITARGSFNAHYENGRFSFSIPSSNPLTAAITGLATVSLYGNFNSNGTYSFTGSVGINFGISSILQISGSLTVTVSNSGFQGRISGNIRILGSNNSVNGFISLTSSGFNMSLSVSFNLGIASLSGTINLSLQNGNLSFSVPSSNPLRFSAAGMLNGVLYGSFNGNGSYNFTGSASLNIGARNVVSFEGSLSVNVSNTSGFRAWATASIYVINSRIAYISGVYVGVSSSGFSLSINNIGFGWSAISLSGSLNLSISSSGVYASASLSANLWGLRGNVSGSFDTRWGRRDWSLSGSVGFSIGNSTIGASGSISLSFGSWGSSFRVSGSAWAGWTISWPEPYVKWCKHWGIPYPCGGGVRWHSSWVGGSIGLSAGLNLGSGTISVSIAGKSVHIQFKNGFRVYLSDVGGSTVFLDVNHNGVQDEGEPFTIADEDGNFSFDEEVDPEVRNDQLGPFEQLDTNGDGVIDPDEARLLITGGTFLDGSSNDSVVTLDNTNLSGVTDIAGGTIFFDANLNGQMDSGEWALTTGSDGSYDFTSAFFPSQLNLQDLLGSLADYDVNNNGVIDPDEGALYVTGGININDNQRNSATFEISGHGVGATEYAGAKVFLDVNGNGVADANEPSVTTTRDGSYSFAPVMEDEIIGLGLLDKFDLNEDGILDAGEGQLYVVGGYTTSRVNTWIQYFDANDNGAYDDGELFVEIPIDELEETTNPLGAFALLDLDGSGNIDDSELALARETDDGLGYLDLNNNNRYDAEEPVVLRDGKFVHKDSHLLVFDADGSGALETEEINRILTAEVGIDHNSAPVAVANHVAGFLPYQGVDYLFFDTNGNGQWDEGEMRTTPDERGYYSFIPAEHHRHRLGRLAPFDTNGNGRIDYEEGVLVVIGGTDNDNGIENPVTIETSAENYGNGIRQTVSPLSTLHSALIQRGLSDTEAETRIRAAFGLDETVDVHEFDPMHEGNQDIEVEGDVLGLAAQINSLMAHGSAVMGDFDDSLSQESIIQALADLIANLSLAETPVDQEQLNLTNIDQLRDIISSAARYRGVQINDDQITAAAIITAHSNVTIAGIVQSSAGDSDRGLAKVKAVSFTHGADLLEQVFRGELHPDEAVKLLTGSAYDDLFNGVELTPEAPPVIGDIDDQDMLQRQSIAIILDIDDVDTRHRHLQVTARSLNADVIADENLQVTFTEGHWVLTIHAAAAALGDAQIEIVASDEGGSFSTTFNVAVAQNPVSIGHIDDQTVNAGDELRLPILIEGVEHDFKLQVISSNGDVLSTNDYFILGEGSERVLVLRPRAGAAGQTTLTVRFNDGEMVTDRSFNVTVFGKAAPEIAKRFPVVEVVAGDDGIVIDLGQYFSDADSDLIYSITEGFGSQGLVSFRVENGLLYLEFADNRAGISNLGIEASDGNKAVSQNLLVRVLPQVAVSDVRVIEGSSTVRFEIRLLTPSNVGIEIGYSTVGDTAVAGVDFVQTSGTIIFHPGQTVAFVDVELLHDFSIESLKRFNLSLENLRNASGNIPGAAASIHDADGSFLHGVRDFFGFSISLRFVDFLVDDLGEDEEDPLFTVIAQPALAPQITISVSSASSGVAGSAGALVPSLADLTTLSALENIRDIKQL